MGSGESIVIDSSTRVLELENRNIEFLPEKVNTKNVVTVHLQNNHVKSVPKKVKSVTSINLCYNKLENIPPKMAKNISGYPKLQVIDLSFNDMKSFPKEMQGMSNLRQLGLYGNKLNYLELNFKRLEILNLGCNLFYEIPELPKTLTSLNIDFNRLTSFNDILPKLTKLSLNLNNIDKFGMNSSFPSLTFLDLSRNKLKSLPDLSIICPKLETICLSHNLLNEFPKLPACISEVLIDNNKIKELPQFALDLPNITFLDLSFNEVTFLSPLPLTIVTLIATNNHLKNISPSETPNLTIVNLSFNNLKIMPQFIRNKIKEIKLQYNNIESFNRFIYSNELRYINLKGNKIAEVPPEIFALPELYALELAYNNIKTLPNEFGATSALTYINLSFNPLTKFTVPVPFSLKKLHLGFCELNQLPPNLSDCYNLEDLFISGNHIDDLPLIPNLLKIYASNNSFVTFPKLSEKIKTADFSLNKIKSFDTAQVRYNELIDLDLSYNFLNTLPILHIPKIKYLKLSGNEFLKCDIFRNDFPHLMTLSVDRTNIIINEVPNNIRELVTNQFDLFTTPYVKTIQSTSDVCFSETIGVRDTMEDSIVVRESIKDDISLFALFDGHGGAKTSTLASYRYAKFTSCYGNFTNEFAEKCISRCNEVIKKSDIKDGSTASIVLRQNDKLIAANLGDSRIVILKNDGSIRFESIDHKVTSRPEFEYVRDQGGRIIRGRIGGILTVSRAIGDFNIQGVSAKPDIFNLNIEEDDKWLILGCDGVWNVMNPEILKKLATTSTNAIEFAISLRNASYALSSSDNITTIVVDLKYTNYESESKTLTTECGDFSATPFLFSLDLFPQADESDSDYEGYSCQIKKPSFSVNTPANIDNDYQEDNNSPFIVNDFVAKSTPKNIVFNGDLKLVSSDTNSEGITSIDF